MQKTNTAKITLLFLLLIAVAVWTAVFTYKPHALRLIACDVGQGDAILATYGNFQILTDGGPLNGKVVECLSRHIPFWDRRIDVVVNTHPQLDHFGGLIEVLKRYKVDSFVATGLDSGSSEYRVLKDLVESKGISVVTPLMGTRVVYDMIYYDIFFPSKEFLLLESFKEEYGKLGIFETSLDPNEFSVQAIISFGEFDALLTGDIGDDMEDEVLTRQKGGIVSRSIEYIKIPHHGSKNSLTEGYLKVINPKVAVISSGANNSYGHPHNEIINLLMAKEIKILRTDEMGDVVVESDGSTWEVKPK